MGRKYPWNNIPRKLTRSSLVRTFNYFLCLGSLGCVSANKKTKERKKKIETTPQCFDIPCNFSPPSLPSLLDHALAHNDFRYLDRFSISLPANKGRDPHSWNSHMSGIKTILNRELTFFLYLHPFVSVIIDKWTRKLVFFSEKFQFMGFCIEKHGVLFLIPTAKLIILILGRIILRRRERLVFLKKNKFRNFRREGEIKFHGILYKILYKES